MNNPQKSFFVTGGTGLIGTNLIPRILRSYPDSTITLLVRAADDNEVAVRVDNIVQRIGTEVSIPDIRQRVRSVRGDVMDNHLGLRDADMAQLVRETTHIIHGAATIRFDHPIDEARRINCGGTEKMLAIARRCRDQGRLERLLYIGTSSVSGRRGGDIFEHELEMHQQFFNTYEQSKCESERIVRNQLEQIPTVIVRPSIVIGDSRTGKTSSFNVIYIPLRLLDRGILSVIPGSPHTSLDLVPVDWVCDVMVYVMGIEAAVGKVCHVTAGPGRAALLGDVVERATEYFNAHHPLPKARRLEFISNEEFERQRAAMQPREAAFLSQLDTILPYVSVDRLFNSATTDALLKDSGIVFPNFRDYAEKIFAWCLDTRWGKQER